MEITKNRLLGMTAGGLGVIGLGLYLFIYHPLLHSLKTQSSACRLVEDELTQARRMIASFKAGGKERVFIPEEEVSLAIDELTRVGKFEEISFISVTPRDSEKPEGPQPQPYKVLPLEMETESTYEALGRFLGSLGELKNSLITVENFNVTPSPEDPSRLRARLKVHLYVAG